MMSMTTDFYTFCRCQMLLNSNMVSVQHSVLTHRRVTNQSETLSLSFLFPCQQCYQLKPHCDHQVRLQARTKQRYTQADVKQKRLHQEICVFTGRNAREEPARQCPGQHQYIYTSLSICLFFIWISIKLRINPPEQWLCDLRCSLPPCVEKPLMCLLECRCHRRNMIKCSSPSSGRKNVVKCCAADRKQLPSPPPTRSSVE